MGSHPIVAKNTKDTPIGIDDIRIDEERNRKNRPPTIPKNMDIIPA